MQVNNVQQLGRKSEGSSVVEGAAIERSEKRGSYLTLVALPWSSKTPRGHSANE